MQQTICPDVFFPVDQSGPFQTWRAVELTAATSTQSASPLAARPQLRVRTHAVRGVLVLEVTGRLSDVVQDLDWAIQLALAEEPRGVVCDLSGVLQGAEPAAVEVLAAAGRHLRDWSGIPVAVACPDPQVREALGARHLGGQLIVTASVLTAVSMVLLTPTLLVAKLRLAPHPSVPRASCDFVTRTLLGWGLDRLAMAANLVVSELVTNSTMHATTDIEVSISWNLQALRLSVRDDSPDLARQGRTPWNLNGSRLNAVADLSRGWGFLPTPDEGKVAWAVINAAQPHPLTCRRRPEPETAPAQPSQVADAGLAEASLRTG